jgi:tetratricopeptide (TPR) repeat protein
MRRDYDGAMTYVERALAAGPSCALAWGISSATHSYLGDSTKAIEHAMHALRLAPLSPDLVHFEQILSQAHYIAGNYGEAIAWGRRAYNRKTSSLATFRTLIASLMAAGNTKEARILGAEMMTLSPDFGLRSFAARTPLPSGIRETFVQELREAGLPD